MCPSQKYGQAQLVFFKGATLLGKFHLLCVICAILHCACGNVDHGHHHYHHLHKHRFISTTAPNPYHPHHQAINPFAHSFSSTNQSELKSNLNNKSDSSPSRQTNSSRDLHIGGALITENNSTANFNAGSSAAERRVEGKNDQDNVAQHRHHDHSSNPVPTTRATITTSKMLHEVWKIYVYSGISVAIISVSSICGVLMVPFLKSTYYPHLINLLIGLAFSSMVGDALLHLLPTVLGITSHSHSSEGNKEQEDNHSHSHGNSVNVNTGQHDHHHHHGHWHDHEENPSEINYMGLMVVIMATVYALFLFEVVSNFFASKRAGGDGDGHGHNSHRHSHQQPTFQKRTESAKSGNQLDTSTLTKVVTDTDNGDQQARTYSSSSEITPILSNTNQEEEEAVTHNHHHNSQKQLYKSSSAAAASESQAKEMTTQPVVMFGLTSLVLIITASDVIHNLLDGVAIGIAFSSSGIASGISTSIAVLFHELPHEFGDFALLLNNGLSVPRAALINLLTALTAFIGLTIGILLGANEEANRWALAICTGLFLYVALVHMLPQLMEMPSTEDGCTTWVISLLMKNVGILLGAGFMIALAKYEDLLKFA